MTPKVHLLEGTKVKLNYKEITSHPDWSRMNPNYIDFIEDNKDTIFTVEYDKLRKDAANKDVFVCLKEDETNPKWKFYTSDLIVQDDQPELKLKDIEVKE